MASTTGNRKTSSTGRSTKKKPASNSRSSSRSTAKKATARTTASKAAAQAAADRELYREIGLIVLFLTVVFLFLCNFDIMGPIGSTVSGVMFGLFGWTAYAAPILLFAAVAFWFANEGNPTALRKLTAGVSLFLIIGIFCDLIGGQAGTLQEYEMKALYEACRDTKSGGGCLAGSVSYLFQSWLETVGTVLVAVLGTLISIILLTERSILRGVKESGTRLKERSMEDVRYHKEMMEVRRQERELRDAERREAQEARLQKRREELEERRIQEENKENEKILRMEKKTSGVMMNTQLERPGKRKREDIHEITIEELNTEQGQQFAEEESVGFGNNREKDWGYQGNEAGKRSHTTQGLDDYVTVSHVARSNVNQQMQEVTFADVMKEQKNMPEETLEYTEIAAKPIREDIQVSANRMHVNDPVSAQTIRVHSEATAAKERPSARLSENPQEAVEDNKQIIKDETRENMIKAPKTYMFPPLSRLQKGKASNSDSANELRETAMRLQQTLNTFGVKVSITDISQGPSVTRYELQPEQGVKVSKIVALADDIKLNLAATDIRIEAPIPGKAAVGIEVPNKENTMVALRDLLESPQFRDFPSNIAFAVGKDIAGQTIVTDIGKMPHMLIAGATGSGKSVCINTLIMSILYKAHPDDVKLIMVDPKVVELSVYNGIPHLLIPVVTDPKKASAALQWGVSEMTDRYKKFADFNVRDLKGYNKKVEEMREKGQEDAPAKMPQIIIIVDELADLMMVAPGEVEASICRLAQLARAAGIHLIIATQRPSVDVITGLIKANMPSRVAFAVSSGVDSRTILDMNGAEKLLGKGDMLFYPQGYSKPARMQGAFVSDKEVADVVDFLKNQAIGNVYSEDVEEKLQNLGSSSSLGSTADQSADGRDEYFAEAGRIIIDKDKASIGMLQRVLKIGFNRAARIMDQLAEYGVVGEEEGTKPRKVLMSPEQFEQLLDEI